MLRGTTVLLGTFTLVAVAAGTAAGQSDGRLVAAPATASPRRPSTVRIAGIAPAPRRVQTRTGANPQFGFDSSVIPTIPTPGIFNAAPAVDAQPQVASFFFLPVVILTDGRIFANFNGRFEQVQRECPTFSGAMPSNFAVAPCWIADRSGRLTAVRRR
jgi:hypothetical protein